MDTYAPSYSRVASQEAGAVADQAERRKYSNMDPSIYLLAPVVIGVRVLFIPTSAPHCSCTAR